MTAIIHLQESTLSKQVKPGFQPGSALLGGYFVGTFATKDVHYGLIVSPQDQGEREVVQWDAYRRNIHAASSTDGWGNTVAMAEAGNPIAQEVLQARIAEFNDWYIPSRDELELIYRRLKPTCDVNLASFRDGENPGSVPPGHAYTAVSPVKTEHKLFQIDGSQAMMPVCYWSSTEFSIYAAWTQSFKDGCQQTNHKVATNRVRLVRKFKLSAQ